MEMFYNLLESAYCVCPFIDLVENHTSKCSHYYIQFSKHIIMFFTVTFLEIFVYNILGYYLPFPLGQLLFCLVPLISLSLEYIVLYNSLPSINYYISIIDDTLVSLCITFLKLLILLINLYPALNVNLFFIIFNLILSLYSIFYKSF